MAATNNINDRIVVIDARDHSNIAWQSLEEIGYNEPGKAHLYNAIGPDAAVGRLDGYEVFAHPTIAPDYAIRCGWRSHLQLSHQAGGYATLAEAKAAGEAWLRKKAAESLAKRIKREARKAMAAGAGQ